jgi:hypothetical protein
VGSTADGFLLIVTSRQTNEQLRGLDGRLKALLGFFSDKKAVVVVITVYVLSFGGVKSLEEATIK